MGLGVFLCFHVWQFFINLLLNNLTHNAKVRTAVTIQMAAAVQTVAAVQTAASV